MRHATRLLIIAGILGFSTIAAGCQCRCSDGSDPGKQAKNGPLVIDGLFIVDHGSYRFDDGTTAYAIVFNKSARDYAHPEPAFIALLKTMKPVIDEALLAGHGGVCLNVPSVADERGVF